MFSASEISTSSSRTYADKAVDAEPIGTQVLVSSVQDIPSEGNAANNDLDETRQFLLFRYIAQAPYQVSEHSNAREETEKDSWSVVGCASMEPTNTSYPIATHTPNVQLTQHHQSFPTPFRYDRMRRGRTDETKPKPLKREISPNAFFPKISQKTVCRKIGRKIFRSPENRPEKSSGQRANIGSRASIFGPSAWMLRHPGLMRESMGRSGHAQHPPPPYIALVPVLDVSP